MNTRNSEGPNLELIESHPDGAAADDRLAERRRLPRLALTSEQFRLKTNGKIFSVVDLSSEGMALRMLDPVDRVLFPMGTQFEGTLNLHGEKHPLRARVRRIGHDTIGCQFEELEASTRAALTRFLDPAILGEELKPIPSSEAGVLWYHGPSGTDLLLRRGADGQYKRVTLHVLGSYVQWDADEGLATGRTRVSREPSEARGIVRFETLLLEPDPRPDAGKLRIAKTLVLSSNLPQELKKWCARQFERGH